MHQQTILTPQQPIADASTAILRCQHCQPLLMPQKPLLMPQQPLLKPATGDANPADPANPASCQFTGSQRGWRQGRSLKIFAAPPKGVQGVSGFFACLLCRNCPRGYPDGARLCHRPSPKIEPKSVPKLASRFHFKHTQHDAK